MRYINIKHLKLPKGWEKKAREAFDAIKDLPPAERIKAINARAAIWQELKDALEELSYGKCWYCESKQDRSDNPVDHFRPKGKVAERPDHGGYWWLAFTWRNYRFSCTYCNSHRKDQKAGKRGGGKQDHFPLLDESTRAFDEQGIDAELYCLLDPIRATDPRLLWFQQDGQVRPRYTKEQNKRNCQRAEDSIKFYHLYHAKLEERRRLLFNDIEELVRDGSRYFDKYVEGDLQQKNPSIESFSRSQNAWKSVPSCRQQQRIMYQG
jgi:uncharacterized protein (TIGR02646 family)